MEYQKGFLYLFQIKLLKHSDRKLHYSLISTPSHHMDVKLLIIIKMEGKESCGGVHLFSLKISQLKRKEGWIKRRNWGKEDRCKEGKEERRTNEKHTIFWILRYKSFVYLKQKPCNASMCRYCDLKKIQNFI